MNEKVMRRLAKPMLFAAAFIWGSSFFIMKDALDALPVQYLLAIRFTAGAVLLGLLCWKKWKIFTPDYLWRGAVIGGFLYLAYSVQTYGLALTTPSKNAFLTAVYCVLVPFLYWAFARVRPDRYNVIAAALCVAGVGLVSLTGDLTVNPGDGLTLISAVFYASHIVAVAKVSRPEVVLPLVYLAVMATTVALLFQNVGQIWSDPASASVILSLESVFGVLCSVVFAGDQVNGRMLLGFALIFVAVVCSETKFSFVRVKG